jgi:GPH family glycoside/pentoside/hexuronide:cation symporter
MYSTVNIPYTALLGVISGDSVERTSASSFKFIGAYLGGIIVSATLLPLSDHFGKVSIAKGWQATIGIYAAAAFVFLMITFLSTRERIQPIAKEKTDVKSDLRDLSKNLPWIWLFIVTILFILFVCIRMNVTTYYFKYYIGEQASPLLAHTFNFVMQYIVNPVYGIIGKPQLALYDPTFKFGFSILTSAFITTGHALSLVGVILVPWAAKICGRKGAVIVLFIIALITTGSYYFLRPEQLMLIFVFQGIVCVTAGPISALLWVLYADTADHSEWKTGRRATGLVFSASIMSNKLGWAVGSMITAFILAQTGFVANVVQKAEVLVGLKAMMSLVPVAIGAIALIVLIFFYKLDEATMAKVKADLDERRKAGQQASGPFSR